MECQKVDTCLKVAGNSGAAHGFRKIACSHECGHRDIFQEISSTQIQRQNGQFQSQFLKRLL